MFQWEQPVPTLLSVLKDSKNPIVAEAGGRHKEEWWEQEAAEHGRHAYLLGKVTGKDLEIVNPVVKHSHYHNLNYVKLKWSTPHQNLSPITTSEYYQCLLKLIATLLCVWWKHHMTSCTHQGFAPSDRHWAGSLKLATERIHKPWGLTNSENP